MKRMPLAQLLVLASLTLAFVGTVGGASLTFGGVAFSPGSTVKANVPLTAQEKSLAAQGGNVVPPNAVAVLATPSNFDPRTSWPVLVICSTSDFKSDTAAWRGAMTLAAIQALRRSFPGSENWPIACAGFSGGGKGVGYVAPLLAKSGCRVSGIYITGANEDHLSDGYAKIGPGASFLNTPIYISAGRDDRIATVEQQYNVAGSIKRTGFQRIRIGTFHGGHEVNDAQTSIALRWFRELAR